MSYSNKGNTIDMTQLLASQTQEAQKKSSLSYFDILSLILVIMKAMGYISCSWIVPFIPICIPIIFYFVVLIISFCGNKFFKK